MQWTRWLQPQERRRTRAPDRALLAAREVRCRPRRRGSSVSVDPGDLVSSGVFGLIDADRAIRPGPRREVRDVRRAAHPRCDLRRAAQARLGAPIGTQPRPAASSGRSPTSSTRSVASPTDDELAQHLDIARAELTRWLAAIAAPRSARSTAPSPPGAEPAASSTAMDSRSPSAMSKTTNCARSCGPRSSSLPDREKLVLSLYYDEGLTLAEIGQVLERHREPCLADPHEVGAAPAFTAHRRRRRLTEEFVRSDPGL